MAVVYSIHTYQPYLYLIRRVNRCGWIYSCNRYLRNQEVRVENKNQNGLPITRGVQVVFCPMNFYWVLIFIMFFFQFSHCNDNVLYCRQCSATINKTLLLHRKRWGTIIHAFFRTCHFLELIRIFCIIKLKNINIYAPSSELCTELRTISPFLLRPVDIDK